MTDIYIMTEGIKMTQYDLGLVIGKDGKGITSIEKTGSSGLEDTYTITFTDESTTTFVVTNGAKGDTGATGATGATGKGITSITKTGTSGKVDTYTITYSDNSTSTFTVTNGNDGVGIQSIEKTSSVGLVDNYRIHFEDSTYYDYTVTNGANGQDGQDGTDGTDGVGISSITKTSTSGLVDTYTITYSNSTTSTFTVTNGATGASTADMVTDSNSANYTSLGTLSANASQQTINNAINSMIGSLLNVDLVIVVSSLPTASADTMNKIYLVANSSSSQSNTYDEHITVRTGTAPNYSYSWEDVGSVSIDLSNYIQKSQTTGLLKNDGTVDTNSYISSLPTSSTSTAGIVQLVDNLTTNDDTKALTAKQGKALYDMIAGIENDMLS